MAKCEPFVLLHTSILAGYWASCTTFTRVVVVNLAVLFRKTKLSCDRPYHAKRRLRKCTILKRWRQDPDLVYPCPAVRSGTSGKFIFPLLNFVHKNVREL